MTNEELVRASAVFGFSIAVSVAIFVTSNVKLLWLFIIVAFFL